MTPEEQAQLDLEAAEKLAAEEKAKADAANADNEPKDENGVPWKNRVAEAQRKQREAEQRLEQERLALEQERAKLKQDVDWEKEEAATGLDKNTLKTIDARADEKSRRLMQIERNADLAVEDVIDELIKDYPDFAKVQREIKRELMRYDPEIRAGKQLIMMVADAKLGKYSRENPGKIGVAKAPAPANVDSGNTGGTGGGSATKGKRVYLSETVKQWAKDNGLADHELTEEKIQEQYDKYIKISTGGK